MVLNHTNYIGHVLATTRENLYLGCATRVDSNWPVQLQKLGRGLKFLI